MAFRILLVDDHKVLREGLKAILAREFEFTVVGEADNGAETVQLTVRISPDIVLMDIGRPGLNGIEASTEILRRCPAARIVILSMHGDEKPRPPSDSRPGPRFRPETFSAKSSTHSAWSRAGELISAPKCLRPAVPGTARRAARRPQESRRSSLAPRSSGPSTDRRRKGKQGNCHRPRTRTQHGAQLSQDHDEKIGRQQPRFTDSGRLLRRSAKRDMLTPSHLD